MSEAKQTTVELSSLSINQLADVKQQLEQEVEHLTESFQKLRQAQLKFKECADTVDQVSNEKNLDKEILVPLTSSLYVPGKVSDVEKFMVDVGTGYYVEKEAIKFFNSKVSTLSKNLVDLETVVNGKVSNLRAVEDALTKKIRESGVPEKS